MHFSDKTLYIIRHCKATGQEPGATLTAEGYGQANALVQQLAHVPFTRIVSSPFRRAQESAAPLAARLGLPVEIDERLAERVLSPDSVPDWMEKLRLSFEDLDLCLAGGESSRVAMARGVAVIEEILAGDAETTAVVTHGNLMTLLLKHFDDRFGFAEWQALTNPDVYQVVLAGERPSVRRIELSV